MRRLALIAAASVISLLAVTGGAQAVVVDMNAVGQPSVAYNPTDQTGYYGVALVPGTSLPATIPAVTSSVSNCDPWLAPGLSLLPSVGLCSHGGSVMHNNETFALTWDPGRAYGAITRDYVEQYLSDVAAGSGSLASPYAVTTQYSDAGGHAGNSSKYGGGCIDYGSSPSGGFTCQFGNTTGTGAGNSYPASGCTATNGISSTNQVCLTDAQIQAELATQVQSTQMLSHLVPNYTPLVVLLTPPGVEVCLDSAGTLCSANAGSSTQFCSYHAQVNVGGTEVAYVVQPWTANTACDEPNLPPLPSHPTIQQVEIDAGTRLVSPLSQAEIAAIVNPGLNGWFAENGAEINDNAGCVPAGYPYDAVTVGTSSQNPYYLQPEFNNAGVIDTAPDVPACTLGVALAPTFVVPSAVEPGDVIQFDGSVTNSTLIVPNLDYQWTFGDGSGAVGPSVEHSYAKGGTYTVKLTVTDRGGNVAAISQTVTVLGSGGQLVSPPPGNSKSPALRVRVQLMPQSLRTVLHDGLAVRVSANQSADGFVTLSIPRSAATRAHISHGRGATVVIGRGTVAGIKQGTVKLHLHLSRTIVAKLGRLGHVTLTVRMALASAAGDRLAIDVAGRY